MQESTPAADGLVRQVVSLQIGVPKETAKEIVKQVKQTKLKVQGQIQEDQVRITGKKRDDLQEVMQLVREGDFPFEFKFVNFRD